ncbi:hypothetical protein [Pseudonocardia sp. ICBG601]|uniref:hypothetical protein n=1 Tax=Pseudonocardia sp. ICBG601 TaxID=2846759 RepID=UPI001CF63AA3|nr:hypothetical protein [Pseudonocardia sp. ICBG601]
MSTTPRHIVSAIADRTRELAALTALTAATTCLTWWFAIPTALVGVWWAAAEMRLRRARRAVTAATAPVQLPTADAVSGSAVTPPEPVSAGQRVEGRAQA